MKKGQVTIFILIGMLVVLFVGFFVFFLQSAPEVSVRESAAAASVRTYLESCFENELEQVTTVVALQGGHYSQPPYTLQYTFDGETYFVYTPYLTYYLFNGQKSVPSLEDVEDAVSEGMVASVAPCLDFSVFPYDVTSSAEQMEVDSALMETEIESKITLPITIIEEGATHQLDSFTISIPTNVYLLYSVAALMTEQQYADENKVCLTCLARFVQDYDVSISAEEFSREESYEILYRLQDPSQGKILFSFVYSFPSSEISSPSVSLLSIPDQDVIIGYPFSYTALAYGVNVTYTDDSSVFDIDPEAGIISFTPTQADIGISIVTITATDAYNQTASQSFVLTIADVVSSDLVVESLPYFTALVGEPFFYQVNATSNYTTYFTDDSSLFVVHPTTGAINFTPTTSDVGEYNFTLTVTDTTGNYNAQEAYMYVVG